jgi:hypothetical protein
MYFLPWHENIKGMCQSARSIRKERKDSKIDYKKLID